MTPLAPKLYPCAECGMRFPATELRESSFHGDRDKPEFECLGCCKKMNGFDEDPYWPLMNREDA